MIIARESSPPDIVRPLPFEYRLKLRPSLVNESSNLTSAIADEIIPQPHDELAAAIMDAVAERDAAAALTALDAALQSGRTVGRLCDRSGDRQRARATTYI